MTHLRRSLLAVASLGALLSGSAAQAAGTPVIVSGPGSYAGNYTQPVAVAQRNDQVTYVNADVQPHDVVAIPYGPDTASHCTEDGDPFTPGVQRRFPLGNCPMFWTPLISIGKTTPLRGLENIEAGKVYPFYCTIHGNMRGQLISI